MLFNVVQVTIHLSALRAGDVEHPTFYDTNIGNNFLSTILWHTF